MHKSAWKFLLLVLALSWPAIYHGHAAMFPDTAAYVTGGQVVFEEAQNRLSDMVSSGQDPAASDSDGQVSARNSVSGKSIRSITYSAFAFALHGPEKLLLGAIFVQAALTAGVIMIMLGVVGGRPLHLPGFIAVTATIAVLTSAPWYASFALPDIFAATGIASIALLAWYHNRLSWLAIAFLVLVGAFSIMVHNSHVPILLSVWLFAAFLKAIAPVVRSKAALKRVLLPVGLAGCGLAAGLAATSMLNYVGLGQAGVFAKHVPLPLARSLEDGPARWHLEATCPVYRYAICDVYDEMPETISEFLWNADTKVTTLASPDELRRIREEEPVILARATRDYPLETVGLFIAHSVSQLGQFGLTEIDFGRRLERLESGRFVLERAEQSRSKMLRTVAEFVQASIVILTLIFLAWRFARHRKFDTDARFTLTITVGLVVNAIICGALSAPVDRYQGRVIWLLPLIGFLFAWKDWQNRSKITSI